MARLSAKVKDWEPSKGAVKGLSNIYDAAVGNRDTLFDIYVTHRSWGEEWYELVRCKSYENAKLMLATRGKGECLTIALNCIDDLAYLEAEMAQIEEGGNK